MAEVADGSASVVSGVVCCWGGEGEQGTGSRTTRAKRLAAKSRPVERMLPLIVLLPLLTFTCNPDAEGLEQLAIAARMDRVPPPHRLPLSHGARFVSPHLQVYRGVRAKLPRCRATAARSLGAASTRRFSSVSIWIVSRICSSVCAAVRKNRKRAARSGTAGYKIGWTLTPRWNIACARRPARIELPVMTGTIDAPIELPTSRPA